MTLTDNDIEDLWDPAEIPWDEVDPKRYARVVEAKVLAKLQNQEPVAFVKENPYCPEGTSDELSTYLPVGTKLYAAPQPAVPPGWKLVPVNPTSEMLSQAHDWQGRRLPVAQYRAMLAVAPEAPAKGEQTVPQGWRFVRRPDGIGIYAPPPRPGESPRTSDTVPASNRDLYDLLGKLADQQAAAPQPSVPTLWHETVKAMREALQDALMLLEAYCDEGEVATRAQARAAIARIDALEGGG